MIVSGRWWWRWKWVDWVDSTLLLIRSRLCTVFICRLCIDTCHFSPCSNAGRLHHNRNLRSSFRFRPVLKDAAHCSTRICASLFFYGKQSWALGKLYHYSFCTQPCRLGKNIWESCTAQQGTSSKFIQNKRRYPFHYLKTLRNHAGNLFFQS